MARYFKFLKNVQGGKKGRFICIILCTMQMTSPLITEIVLILSIGRSGHYSSIIKSFVALGFITKIDDMFSENFPAEVKKLAGSMEMQIGLD